MRIVLASASERRKDLLQIICNNFDIIVSNFDESCIMYNGDVKSYVMDLSKGKAMNVCNSLKNSAIVIGCDTLVFFENSILGKPKTKEEAYHMLKKLSGNIHKVYSGITVIDSNTGHSISDYVCTKVQFSHLTDDQIEKYIDSGDPMDKAGSYGIQGQAGVFVEKIDGCYYNVVGLPLNKLYYMLKRIGVNL
ncbi:Maf-like protein [Clostridium oceanicum]|uniref:dTTP/UTP pyrophosphatase n=1 Tax=Clostridium oceanicum TaxID=1543 RepID=A0ABP3V4T9_9CLOT